MLDFSQECGSTVRFNELAVKVSRVFYCFVFFRQDLHPEYDGVQEELTKNRATLIALPVLCLLLENKADSILHNKESALLAISSQAIPYLLINLRHCPGWHLIGSTLGVDKSCA